MEEHLSANPAQGHQNMAYNRGHGPRYRGNVARGCKNATDKRGNKLNFNGIFSAGEEPSDQNVALGEEKTMTSMENGPRFDDSMAQAE